MLCVELAKEVKIKIKLVNHLQFCGVSIHFKWPCTFTSKNTKEALNRSLNVPFSNYLWTNPPVVGPPCACVFELLDSCYVISLLLGIGFQVIGTNLGVLVESS